MPPENTGFPDGNRSPRPEVDRFLPLVYDELRALARTYLRGESPGHTLQPTALVHEAYIKLAKQCPIDWKGRTHVLAFGSRAMRQILVDHARSRKRKKRWGGCLRMEMDDESAFVTFCPESILAIDKAISRLAEQYPARAQIVELRFFGGLSVEEIAEELSCSKRTVEQHWTFLRAWLRRELRSERP